MKSFDHRRDGERRQDGPVVDRHGVRAERPVREDAPKALPRQAFGDSVPQPVVDQDPVDEQHRGVRRVVGADDPVVDRGLLQRDLRHDHHLSGDRRNLRHHRMRRPLVQQGICTWPTDPWPPRRCFSWPCRCRFGLLGDGYRFVIISRRASPKPDTLGGAAPMTDEQATNQVVDCGAADRRCRQTAGCQRQPRFLSCTSLHDPPYQAAAYLNFAPARGRIRSSAFAKSPPPCWRTAGGRRPRWASTSA